MGQRRLLHAFERATRKLADEAALPDSGQHAERRRQGHVTFGVIGYGYWGPQLVRNLDNLALGDVTMVADLSPERRDAASFAYPWIPVTDSVDEVLDSEVDAVVIATPIPTHYKLAKLALEKGKDVFVEKPLTAHVDEAEDLIALSERTGRILMVGHTFLYNPAVEELRRLVQDGALGAVHYVDAVRVNLGLFQRDINVMWDLAPHDISILNYVLGMEPLAVSAHGGAYVREHIHDIVYLTIEYPGGVLAHIHVSWLNPSKVRRFTVVGNKQMAVYDDVEATEKIRIFNRGVDAPPHSSTFGEFQLSYRYGDIVSPHIRWSEPLAVECNEFAQAILERRPPRTDGSNGLSVVRVLEAAEYSLQHAGVRVSISSPAEYAIALDQ